MDNKVKGRPNELKQPSQWKAHNARDHPKSSELGDAAQEILLHWKK